jgi:hypothetical protein
VEVEGKQIFYLHGDIPRDKKLEGRSVDMFYFNVCATNNPDVETFKRLIAEHKGEWGEMNPLDEKEHSYIEVGGWIGDQSLAMQFMALGELLGLWRVMQPTMIGLDRHEEVAQQMAGAGLVSILPK